MVCLTGGEVPERLEAPVDTKAESVEKFVHALKIPAKLFSVIRVMLIPAPHA
jgi:hypothetical protein